MKTPRHTPIAVATSLFMLAAVVSTAGAHETWLQPISFFVDKPAAQIVHMTSAMGEHYTTPETAIEPSRVARSGVWFAGARLPLTQPTKQEHELALTWTPTKSGVGAIFVELAPRVLDLPDSLINEYFDEIGASPELRKQWTDTPSPKRWRESYAKHAKTYVRVGDAKAAYPWRGETGMGLEIVPGSDPTRIVAGDTVSFGVVYKGKRMTRFTLAVFREGAAKAEFITTNRAGRALFPAAAAGNVLLTGVHLRRVHEPSLEWRSDFTTMTLRVQARR